jgi:hypothetical protein
VSVFTQCEQGHDLTREMAYLHLPNGNRVCRSCHYARLPKSKQMKGDYAGLARLG